MKTYLLFVFVLFCGFCFAQAPGDLPPNAQPGKCYAKCLILDESIDTIFHDHPVYTGDPENKKVKRKKVKVGDEIWEVVKRPKRTTEFEWKTYVETKVRNGYTKWFEVLCVDKVNTSTITQIQKALREEGYLKYSGTKDKQLDSETKEALKQFQRDFNLPVGNLDLETLAALGVDY